MKKLHQNFSCHLLIGLFACYALSIVTGRGIFTTMPANLGADSFEIEDETSTIPQVSFEGIGDEEVESIQQTTPDEYALTFDTFPTVEADLKAQFPVPTSSNTQPEEKNQTFSNESLETTTGIVSGSTTNTMLVKTGRHFGNRIRQQTVVEPAVLEISSSSRPVANQIQTIHPSLLKPRPTSPVIAFTPNTYKRILRRRKNFTRSQYDSQEIATTESVTTQPPFRTTRTSSYFERRKLFYSSRSFSTTAMPTTSSYEEDEISTTTELPTTYSLKAIRNRKVQLPKIRLPTLPTPPSTSPTSENADRDVNSSHSWEKFSLRPISPPPPPDEPFEITGDEITQFHYTSTISSTPAASTIDAISSSQILSLGADEDAYVLSEDEPLETHGISSTTVPSVLTKQQVFQDEIEASEIVGFPTKVPPAYRDYFSEEIEDDDVKFQKTPHEKEITPQVTVTVTVTQLDSNPTTAQEKAEHFETVTATPTLPVFTEATSIITRNHTRIDDPIVDFKLPSTTNKIKENKTLQEDISLETALEATPVDPSRSSTVGINLEVSEDYSTVLLPTTTTEKVKKKEGSHEQSHNHHHIHHHHHHHVGKQANDAISNNEDSKFLIEPTLPTNHIENNKATPGSSNNLITTTSKIQNEAEKTSLLSTTTVSTTAPVSTTTDQTPGKGSSPLHPVTTHATTSTVQTKDDNEHVTIQTSEENKITSTEDEEESNAGEQSYRNNSHTDSVPSVAVFVQILLDMSPGQFCPTAKTFKEMIIFIFKHNNQEIGKEQIAVYSEPNCFGGATASKTGGRHNSNSSPASRTPTKFGGSKKLLETSSSGTIGKSIKKTEIQLDTIFYPVYIYLTDKNGNYDQQLTESFIHLWNITKPNEDLLMFNKIRRVEMIINPSDEFDDNDGPTNENSPIILSISVATAILICLLIVGILLLVIRHRQSQNTFAKRCTPVTLDDYSLDNISVFNSFRRKQRNRGSKRSYTNAGFDDNAPSRKLDLDGLTKAVKDTSTIYDEFVAIPNHNATLDDIPNGAESKNRYANVIPIPDTRVLLTFQEEHPNSDYINANFIQGANGVNKAYIITQGPLEETVMDFWRMVWEQQVRVILMLTDFSEAGIPKCAEYYPRSESIDCHQLHGDFQVTLEKKEIGEHCITSFLVLKDMTRNLRRDLIHLWYLSWPEKGVPDSPKPTLDFIMKSRKFTKEATPVLVHCSPGTGRSGTLVSVDISLRELELKQKVDIPQVVKQVRHGRSGAVQTKEQYRHIYEVSQFYASKYLAHTSKEIVTTEMKST